MSGIHEKFNKLGIKHPFYFSILSIILTVVFFLLFLINSKSYQSEISILFIPKSGETILQSEQIIQNIMELPSRLAFYEKILEDNKNIKDSFSGYSKDEQKKLWNDLLEIKRRNNSGVIDIKVAGKSRQEAADITKQTAFTLFGSMSQYYDVKNDIDLRVVDGPITYSSVKSIYQGVFLSIIASLAVTYFFFMVFYKVQNIFPRKKIPNTKDLSREDKRSNQILSYVSKLTGKTIKKHKAPENLPVIEGVFNPAEDNYEENIDEQIENLAIQETQEPADYSQDEPTEEELKERLNQLLRGGM